MPPQAAQPLGPGEQLVAFLLRGLRWLLGRTLGRWPYRGTVSFWRTVFDRPNLALACAAPVVVIVASVWVLADGAARGRWMTELARAWRREEIARLNLATVEGVLVECDRERPVPPRARRMTRQEQAELASWKAWRADLTGRRDVYARGVPSRLRPLPPDHELPTASAVVYVAHHLLFRTVYPFVPLVYLAIGVIPGWLSCQTRRRRKWQAAREAAARDQVLLGLDDKSRAHFLPEATRPHHLLVVGTTGSGKSVALEHLARADVRAGHGLIFFDLKGERALTEAIHRACLEAGRSRDFRLFTFDGPSHSYNPLGRGDATALRDRILSACVWSDEVFYENAAKAVMGRYLPPMLAKGRITFRDLYQLLADRDAAPLVSRFMHDEDARRAQDDIADFVRFQKHTAALLDNVSDFAAAHVRDRLCVPYADIDLAAANRDDLVVVFELNSQMRPKAASTLARMALEDLKHFAGWLGQARHAQKPFHVYVDEAGRAVYPGFAGLIAQCRSAGIGLTLAAQAPDNFDTEEGRLMTTVLQNTGTKLILRQLDHESAELCAKLGGTYTTRERTTQLADQGLLLGLAETGVFSDREVDKFYAHPKDQTDCDQAHASSFRGHGGGHDRPAGPPLVREARRGRAPARSGWCLGSGTRWEAGGPALLLDQSRAAASGAGRWGTTGAAGA